MSKINALDLMYLQASKRVLVTRSPSSLWKRVRALRTISKRKKHSNTVRRVREGTEL